MKLTRQSSALSGGAGDALCPQGSYESSRAHRAVRLSGLWPVDVQESRLSEALEAALLSL